MRWIADNRGQLSATFNEQPSFCRRLLLTVCDCRRFTANRIWICTLFGHGEVMENQCWKARETPSYYWTVLGGWLLRLPHSYPLHTPSLREIDWLTFSVSAASDSVQLVYFEFGFLLHSWIVTLKLLFVCFHNSNNHNNSIQRICSCVWFRKVLL